jgi:hypothetical protein
MARQTPIEGAMLMYIKMIAHHFVRLLANSFSSSSAVNSLVGLDLSH